MLVKGVDFFRDGRMVGWSDGRMVGWSDGRLPRLPHLIFHTFSYVNRTRIREESVKKFFQWAEKKIGTVRDTAL